MRIPLEDQHYLTTGYIKKFGIEMVPFYNKDKEGNCFYKVLGSETIKISGKNFKTTILTSLGKQGFNFTITISRLHSEQRHMVQSYTNQVRSV